VDRIGLTGLCQKGMGAGYKLENSPALAIQNAVIFFMRLPC